MSERTAQCEECTDVFPCNPTGRLPKLCPKCRSADSEAPARSTKARKKRAAPSHNGSSPAIATAILALQEEIEALEGQITVRREALEALEAVA